MRCPWPGERSMTLAPLVRLLAVAALAAAPHAALAQQSDLAEREALAVARAALDAVTAEDVLALTDLMVSEALIFTVSGPSNDLRHSSRCRAEQRSRGFSGDIVERGFEPRVRVASGLATVWLPARMVLNG